MKISRIVELYKLHNYTQQSLADAIGMSKTNLNFILVGKQEIRASVLEKLAKLFNVKAGYFFDDYDETNIKPIQELKYYQENSNIIITNQRIKDLEEIIKSKNEIIELQKTLLGKKD